MTKFFSTSLSAVLIMSFVACAPARRELNGGKTPPGAPAADTSQKTTSQDPAADPTKPLTPTAHDVSTIKPDPNLILSAPDISSIQSGYTNEADATTRSLMVVLGFKGGIFRMKASTMPATQGAPVTDGQGHVMLSAVSDGKTTAAFCADSSGDTTKGIEQCTLVRFTIALNYKDANASTAAGVPGTLIVESDRRNNRQAVIQVKSADGKSVDINGDYGYANVISDQFTLTDKDGKTVVQKKAMTVDARSGKGGAATKAQRTDFGALSVKIQNVTDDKGEKISFADSDNYSINGTVITYSFSDIDSKGVIRAATLAIDTSKQIEDAQVKSIDAGTAAATTSAPTVDPAVSAGSTGTGTTDPATSTGTSGTGSADPAISAGSSAAGNAGAATSTGTSTTGTAGSSSPSTGSTASGSVAPKASAAQKAAAASAKKAPDSAKQAVDADAAAKKAADAAASPQNQANDGKNKNLADGKRVSTFTGDFKDIGSKLNHVAHRVDNATKSAISSTSGFIGKEATKYSQWMASKKTDNTQTQQTSQQ